MHNALLTLQICGLAIYQTVMVCYIECHEAILWFWFIPIVRDLPRRSKLRLVVLINVSDSSERLRVSVDF